jgi:hypothetical protein
MIDATPVVMALSATLKTGLKNSNLSPPQIGSQDGRMGVDHWKIQHVYHLALEEGSVACAKGYKLCQAAMVVRFRKNHTVKNAVDDVANGTGYNEAETKEQ